MIRDLRRLRTLKIGIATAAFVFIVIGLLKTVQPLAFSWTFTPRSGAVAIDSSPAPNVTAFSLDAPRVDPKFLDLFDRMGEDWVYFRPFSFVISNQADQGIAALTVAWTVTDATGKTKAEYTSWETYTNALLAEPPGGPRAGAGNRGAAQRGVPPADFADSLVLASQAQLLVVPVQCPPVSLCGNSGGTGGSMASRLVNPNLRIPNKAYIGNFKSAQRVGVSIDLVVFSDGHFSGPDQGHLLATLGARHNAVRMLSERARAVTKAGGDIDVLLAGLGTSKATPETDIAGYFLGEHARSIAMTNAPRQALQRFESLKPLPPFVRD